jgi:hypothetical protein
MIVSDSFELVIMYWYIYNHSRDPRSVTWLCASRKLVRNRPGRRLKRLSEISLTMADLFAYPLDVYFPYFTRF